MIKVTLGEKPKEENKKPFPKLMRIIESHNYAGRIVLFGEDRKGVVVSPSYNKEHLELGYYNDSWRMECFDDYDDKVTLQNT